MKFESLRQQLTAIKIEFIQIEINLKHELIIQISNFQ